MNRLQLRPTSREERAHHVAQMRGNSAIEGMLPDADDLELQQCYIDGQISISEMLQYAQGFARKPVTK